MLESCKLCPRCCGVDRHRGEQGRCGAGFHAQVFRYGPHHGEEPPISGVRGSGTVFFSRCTLNCIYCQNYPWSQLGKGDIYPHERLVHAFKALAAHGCHNWNLVSPTPWMPAVHEVLAALRKENICIPVVYNTSGYERIETLDAYAEDIQVYLTDLRYARASTALSGSDAADYVEYARQALLWMWKRLGALRCDENDVALSGVICRILVLPGFADEAIANLEWLASELGCDVAVSVMAQYHPAWMASGAEPWNRSVTDAEYNRVCEAVESLGFNTGWMQDPGQGTEDGLLGHTMRQGGFDDEITV